MATANVSAMTMEELAKWLKSVGIDDKTCEALKDEEVDGKAFLKLQEKDLKDMGFKLGTRRNLQELQEKENSQKKEKEKLQKPQEKVKETNKVAEHMKSQVKSSSKDVTTKQDEIPVYLLPRKNKMENKEKMLAKFDIGEKPATHKTEKVLMVVGATGAGKSTLINSMVNYIFGVEWEDNFRFKLVVDEGGKSQAHSQTSAITAYTIHQVDGSPLNYTFTIIDTPGFGDTRGLERDKFITQQIKEFFSIQSSDGGIDHIDAVGFVTQASLARLTATQKYIFHSILSVFGKDIEKNIFLMVTFADGKKPPVMDAVEEAKIPSAGFFKFNNSVIFCKPDPNDNFDQMFWKMGIYSFESFFKKFVHVESVSLQMTKEVLHEREQLETTVQGLQEQINAGVAKIEELRQEERVVKQKQAEISANKNFKYTVKITKQKKVDLETGEYVTNCLVCNYTCHKLCRISEDAKKYKCASMDRSRGQENATCKVCPQKCHWEKHHNNPYRFELYNEDEVRTFDDLKKNYDDATKGLSTAQAIKQNLEAYLKNVEGQVKYMLRSVQESLHRLDEIALKPNPLTEVEHLDVLIQSERDQKNEGYQERIAFYQKAKEEAKIMGEARNPDRILQKIQPKLQSNTQEQSKGQRSWFKFWK